VVAVLVAGCGQAAPVADVEPADGEPAVREPPQIEAVEVDPVEDEEQVIVDVAYRIEVRTSDEATADATEIVHAVLTDPRGWSRAGFRFVLDPDAAYTVVIAEGPEVDELCHPYETWSTYSCQNGPVVALNADRWRYGTEQWPADLDSYRVMLVNHEVGHLLHLHHPDPQCPGAGLPAPVMAQQSTSLGDCLPNPWPLQWEIDLAVQRLEPLAPPADHDPSDHRPAPPPVRS
jgi:hypothetical protein